MGGVLYTRERTIDLLCGASDIDMFTAICKVISPAWMSEDELLNIIKTSPILGRLNAFNVCAATFRVEYTRTDYEGALIAAINGQYNNDNEKKSNVMRIIYDYAAGSKIKQLALLTVLEDDVYNGACDKYKDDEILKKFLSDSDKKIVLELCNLWDGYSVDSYIGDKKDKCKNEKERLAFRTRLISIVSKYYKDIPPIVCDEIYRYYSNTSNIEIIKKEIFSEDDKDIFKSSVFGCDAIKFNPATINIIAARPGHGKTTALVSLACDAIRQDRNVVFLTTEERILSIYYRVLRNEIYTNNINYDDMMDLMVSLSNVGVNNYIANYIKGLITDNQSKFSLLFDKSIKTVDSWLGAGSKKKLVIYSTMSCYLQEVLNYLMFIPTNWVVIIDYMQRLPKMSNDNNYRTPSSRQLEIQDTEKAICDIVQQKKLICIAGAQFGRPDSNRKDFSPIPMSYDNLRESGDIEQDASCIVALNDYYLNNDSSNNAGRLFYYQQLKNREGELDSGMYNLLGNDYGKTSLALAYSVVGDGGSPLRVFNQKSKDKDFSVSGSSGFRSFGGLA